MKYNPSKLTKYTKVKMVKNFKILQMCHYGFSDPKKFWNLLYSIITIKYLKMKEIKISNYQNCPKLPGSYRNWALKSFKNDFSWTWTFQFAAFWRVVRVSLIPCRPKEPRKSIVVPYSSCKSDDSCSRKDQFTLGHPSRLVQDYIISSYSMLPESCPCLLQLNDL